MTEIQRTQVLVAGGGPVGLIAALCAVKRGLDVVVIERNFRGTPRGHTTLLHPSSLRLLSELGLTPLLLRSGRLLDHIELSVESGTHRLELPFPALALTQALFEETLLQVLHKEEVELRATSDVHSLTQDEQGVDVKVVRREQLSQASAPDRSHWQMTDSSTIRARFVIGADGRSSYVRQSLGLATACGPVDRYAMFEFPSQSLPAARLAFADGMASFLTPLHEQRARASFQLAPDERATPDLTLLSQLLQQRAPQQLAPRELHWSGVLDFECTLAEAFGKGRVWLAGDAAHTTSPLGVQSMNYGLSEVFQLVAAMAAVEAGQKPLVTLERSSEALRRDWQQTVAHDAPLELLAHAPSWLSRYAGQLSIALPISGYDRDSVLAQLGIAGRARR